MSALAAALLAELDEETLDTLADLLAVRLEQRLGQRGHAHARATGWLNAEQAAEHLACSRGRIYDLVQLGKLTPRRDGRRVLFQREDLDGCLESA
jgi:excisionase family DNA binding protein